MGALQDAWEAEKQDTQPKSERWHTIEGRHFGRCMWQMRSQDGRGLIEGLIHKATGRIMIVTKMYDKRLPPRDSGKPWPDLIGVDVYAQIDRDNITWDGLEQALTNFK